MHRLLHVLFVLGVAVTAMAQPATPAQREGTTPDKDYETMHLTTKIGSCKFLDGVGRLEISFSGSLLLSQVKGKVQVSGTLQKQYSDPKHNRELYYGKGKIIVTGSWRGLQWFGKDMSAVWFGRGSVRLSGEYYESATKPGTFESGWFWYADPAKRQAWPATGSFEYRLPGYKPPTPVVPRRRT